MSPVTATTWWMLGEATLTGWMQVLNQISEEENFACGIPTEHGVRKRLSGSWKQPWEVDIPSAHVMDAEDRMPALPGRPSHLPWGPDSGVVGGLHQRAP